jgi:arylsulfatase A-like enzyme
MPWYAPKKYFDMYDTANIDLPPIMNNDLDDVPTAALIQSRIGIHEEILRTGNWKMAIQGYLACITFADEVIGTLLDALYASKYADNTVIVFAGDHGWLLGEKSHWEKNMLWEESVKTPLIIYDPDIGHGTVVNQAVSLQDIYPTLVDLCELPPKTDISGRSLKPLMVNPQDKYFIGWAFTLKREARSLQVAKSLRTNRYRYSQYSVGAELYDLIVDPNSWTNLIDDPEYAPVVAGLSDDIDRLMKNQEPVNTDVYEFDPTGISPKQMLFNNQQVVVSSRPVTVEVYDLKGKLVYAQTNTSMTEVYKILRRDMDSHRGIFVSQGVFLMRLSTNGVSISNKFIKVK